MDRICMTLGGRVSEEIIFGPENITTGAQDDLQKITRMAFEACANYGMNTIIGPVSYGGREGQKESWTKPFSEKTGEMLDAEVRKMITYVIFCCDQVYRMIYDISLARRIRERPNSLPAIAKTLRKSQSYCWRRRLLLGTRLNLSIYVALNIPFFF